MIMHACNFFYIEFYDDHFPVRDLAICFLFKFFLNNALPPIVHIDVCGISTWYKERQHFYFILPIFQNVRVF